MRKNHIFFYVSGKVQGVMFRQTFIRACQSRGLKGAASNLSDGTVSCFISGDANMTDDIIANLLSGNAINSWGACVDEMIPISDAEGIPFEKHQVTTANVDNFNWSSDIDMYL
jgi:acylphosphatase